MPNICYKESKEMFMPVFRGLLDYVFFEIRLKLRRYYMN